MQVKSESADAQHHDTRTDTAPDVHRIRGIHAVAEHIVPVSIAGDALIVFESLNQAVERLDREFRICCTVARSATKTGCEASPRTWPASSLAPPGQQTQAFRAIADFIAQIVGPPAKRIDVVEILMQVLRKQKADDLEILVVVRRQPARVGQASASGYESASGGICRT